MTRLYYYELDRIRPIGRGRPEMNVIRDKKWTNREHIWAKRNNDPNIKVYSFCSVCVEAYKVAIPELRHGRLRHIRLGYVTITLECEAMQRSLIEQDMLYVVVPNVDKPVLVSKAELRREFPLEDSLSSNEV